ncbi:MAG: aminoacetone oxidase family FAD-binding enzyme [Planctomycetota bacterium]|jgi:predicted Rossmann fold flavoprotein
MMLRPDTSAVSHDVLVVGAGPAGLAAAVSAGRAGKRVLVLEKNDRPGRKLLLTGGGRCNIWDPERPPLEALEAFGRPGRFLRQCLTAFDWAGFLENLGLETEREDDSVYVRGGAAAMLEALLAGVRAAGVEVRTGAAVRSVTRDEDGGFRVACSSETLRAGCLVLATGGMTHPGTGSGGDGYEWAAGAGHEIAPPCPALCALVTEPCFEDLAGVSLPRAEVSFEAGKRRRLSRAGGLLFTHRGLSGPAALDASLEMARSGFAAGGSLRVDLVPGLSVAELTDALVARARAETKRPIRTAGLGELLPVRLLALLAGTAGIRPDRRMASISLKEHGRIAALAKGLSLKLKEPFGAEDAMITAGGVSTKKIDPKTMLSRIVPGLYLAGELLEPAGPCGGWNLLMAFATGTAAGSAAVPREA